MKVKFLILFLYLSLLNINAKEYTIYVSPKGNDKNVGNLENPLRSVYEVHNKLRHIVSEDAAANIKVVFRDGKYFLNKTLILNSECVPDRGSLCFCAYGDEEPIITSEVPVVNWKKVDNYPTGTPEAAKGYLWEADLPKELNSFKVLFDGDSILTRSHSKHFTVKKKRTIEISDSQNVKYNKDRIHLRMLPFTDQIKDWDNIHDIEAVFNPVPWNINYIQLESVDMNNKIAYLSYEANAMPFTGWNGYAFIENAIDYLDEPGEWCVNTKSRKIYYWPKDNKPSDNISAPLLREFIRVEGKINYDLLNDVPVENVSFVGLTFKHGDRTVWYKNRKGWGIQHDWDTFDYGNAMLRFRGAKSCVIDKCHFSTSGSSAIRLDLYEQNNKITNNYIENVGHMGILLAGYGPGLKDVNKHNIIENNVIHHCGRIIWHGHGIFVWQSGENIIRNNFIHDVPRKAIGVCGVRCQILMKPDCDFDEASKTIRWNEIESKIDSSKAIIKRYAPFLHARNNIIENNHIERTQLKLSDGASINVSGAGTGNIIRHNLLYDIPFVGIRNDDWQDGTTIENNIVDKAGIGIIHKGINTVRNNILINCKTGIRFRAYPQQFFEPISDISHNIYYNDSEKFKPFTEFSWGKMFVHHQGTKSVPYEYQLDYNCYYFPNSEKVLDGIKTKGIESHSVSMNPGFYNIEKMDFRIKNKKMLKAIDFKTFDVNLNSYGITKDYPEKYNMLNNKSLNK